MLPFSRRVCALVACVLLAAASPFRLQDASLEFSAFGTLGYALSDQDFQYLRYIDDGGTLKVDSLVGVQAEAQFNSQWGPTVQMKTLLPKR